MRQIVKGDKKCLKLLILDQSNLNLIESNSLFFTQKNNKLSYQKKLIKIEQKKLSSKAKFNLNFNLTLTFSVVYAQHEYKY